MEDGQMFHVVVVEHHVGNLLSMSVVDIFYLLEEGFQHLLVMVVIYALSSR